MAAQGKYCGKLSGLLGKNEESMAPVITVSSLESSAHVVASPVPCRDLPPPREGFNMAYLKKTQTLRLYAEQMLTFFSLLLFPRPSSGHLTSMNPHSLRLGPEVQRCQDFTKQEHSQLRVQGVATVRLGQEGRGGRGGQEGLEEAPAVCLPHGVFVGFQHHSIPLLSCWAAWFQHRGLPPSSASQLCPVPSQPLKQISICLPLPVLGRLWFGYSVAGQQRGPMFESKHVSYEVLQTHLPSAVLSSYCPKQDPFVIWVPSSPSSGRRVELVPVKSESTNSVPPGRLTLSEQHCIPRHRACFAYGRGQLPSLSTGICGKAQMIGL